MFISLVRIENKVWVQLTNSHFLIRGNWLYPNGSQKCVLPQVVPNFKDIVEQKLFLGGTPRVHLSKNRPLFLLSNLL
jgi:hypothetical protein